MVILDVYASERMKQTWKQWNLGDIYIIGDNEYNKVGWSIFFGS